MPTIAELQVTVDSSPLERATKNFNDFAEAAGRASNAAKVNSSVSENGISSANKAAQAEQNLTTAIDAQAKKLANLAEQRKKLAQSDLKSTAPEEYARLNSIIDANIEKVVRQGNAVEQVSRLQERDSTKRKAAADAELRAQERLVRASESQAAAVSNAAARQQSSIDSTVAGLSKQIKAQQDYNKTIEELNRTRALSGLAGPQDSRPTLSSQEYDTYVKLAQAQRDSALAAEDNSKAIVRQQSKLESITATLGKVERAEVQYARNVRVLDDSLQKGIISVQQYDQQLSRFAAKRDSAIQAANDNSIAERNFANQLQNVLAAYDPVQRAQDNYNQSVETLSRGLQEGKISLDQYNKAVDQQKKALDEVKATQSGTKNLADEYQKALNSVLPYRTELRNLELQQKRLDAAKEAGKFTTAQQIKEYDDATAAIKRQTAEYNKRIEAGAKAGNTFKQDQQALRGLPAQFTDIVVSLQGGQAPLTVLLQQGGQIKDTFGGVIPALKGVATGLAAIITPATVGAVVIAGIGYAAFDAAKELEDFNKATVLSGGRSGVSAAGFADLRNRLDDTTSTSRAAAAALIEIQSSGKIAEDSFYGVAQAALNFEKATGQAVKQTVEDFASLGKDPVNAAISLDEKYKFLTASVLAQAVALREQNKETEAVTLLQNTLAEATDQAAKRIIEQAGYITKAWNAVKFAVSETVDAVYDVGRVRPAGEQVADLEKEIEVRKRYFENIAGENKERAKTLIADDYYIRNQQKKLDALKPLAAAEEAQAKAQKQREDQRRSSVAFTERAEKALSTSDTTEVDRIRKEQEKYQKDRANAFLIAAEQGKLLTQEQISLYDRYEKDIQRRLDDAIEKQKKKDAGPSTPVDSRIVTEVKSNIGLITNEYDNYYKKVTALGKNNVVSEAATVASQKAILEAQKNATISAYDDQISAIRKLQGVKGNTAAQNISLDNQLTKAEADRLKAQQDFTAKQEQLDEKLVASNEKKKASIEAYRDALRQQVENVVTSGDRAVAAVGRGDRQGNVNEQLADADRQFARDRMSLERQLAKGLDPDEYTQKLALLKDTHTELTETIISNDERLKVSQADWTNGLTRALENLEDSANNVAAAVDKGLTGAFNSAGDALGQFVVTGKLNFRDFATSVIADMAKIAAQQAASQALSGLFNLAFTVGSAYLGGTGPNGFAAGSAGAKSSALGASSAGYSSQYFRQAKGGGWTGGTQFFAQGGAFTNSIVSTPTAFGMSGNRRGVMGEAGPEAIVPLARASDGSLGVRMVGASGGASSGGVNVYVTISDSGTTTTTDAPAAQQFGQELGQFVESKYRQLLARDLADGGAIKQTIKSG
jgi:lambda family phage tail tape measure protein